MLRWGGPLLSAAILIAILALLRRTFVPLRRREARARLFELLALALRRGEAVAPVVRVWVDSASRRDRSKFDACARRFESGSSFADAVAGVATRSQVAGLRSVAGEAGLVQLLERYAAEHDRGVVESNRLRSIAAYALFITSILLYAFQGVLFQTRGFEFAATEGLTVAPWTWLVFFVAGIVFLLSHAELPRALEWVRARIVLRGPLRRLQELDALDRAFRAAGLHLRTGGRESEGFRRGAAVSDDASVRRAMATVGESIERGLNLTEAASRAGMPDFVVQRFGGTNGHVAAPTARVLDEIAEACARRRARFVSRALRWTTPAVLLILGALVGLHFAHVFDVWYGVLQREILQ